MIQSLEIKNFTVFGEARLDFGRHLNVIAGENGSAKTHLLKLAYAALVPAGRRGGSPARRRLPPRPSFRRVWRRRSSAYSGPRPSGASPGDARAESAATSP